MRIRALRMTLSALNVDMMNPLPPQEETLQTLPQGLACQEVLPSETPLLEDSETERMPADLDLNGVLSTWGLQIERTILSIRSWYRIRCW